MIHPMLMLLLLLTAHFVVVRDCPSWSGESDTAVASLRMSLKLCWCFLWLFCFFWNKDVGVLMLNWLLSYHQISFDVCLIFSSWRKHAAYVTAEYFRVTPILLSTKRLYEFFLFNNGMLGSCCILLISLFLHEVDFHPWLHESCQYRIAEMSCHA